jgi:hypothetical protein
VMVAPTALAETVTPPIFSPAGDVTVPVRVVGSAAHKAVVNAALDNNDSITAAPVLRVEMDDERRDMAGSPVSMASLSVRFNAMD